MIEMKSSAAVLNGTPEDVYKRLSNPAGLKTLLNESIEKARREGKEIPAEVEDNLDKIDFTENSISISAGAAGTLKFKLGDCTPYEDVKYEGDGTPIAIIIDFNLTPEGIDKCFMSIMLQADMPFMLRAMVQAPMRKALDTLSGMMQQIPSWR